MLLSEDAPDVLMAPMVGSPIYSSFEAPLRLASSLPLRFIVPVLAPPRLISVLLTVKPASFTWLAGGMGSI